MQVIKRVVVTTTNNYKCALQNIQEYNTVSRCYNALVKEYHTLAFDLKSLNGLAKCYSGLRLSQFALADISQKALDFCRQRSA